MSHSPNFLPVTRPTMMNNSVILSLTAAAWLLAGAAPARAALPFDTGAPSGAPFAYAFDSSDFYAGLVTLDEAAQLSSIAAHMVGGSAGETFTLTIYSDSATHLPDTALYAATATFTVDGWNGVAGLSGWNLAAGSYWVGLEIGALDTLGTATGNALLDRGTPRPLAQTAFNSGSGYVSSPVDFGLQVSAVPEPANVALMLAGLVGLVPLTRRTRRGRTASV